MKKYLYAAIIVILFSGCNSYKTFGVITGNRLTFYP
ncbi:MAG: lipoprotein [Candidatus Kapabacteria bacterium]|nr:lipoprotein [Candidatus Kapabacteria bacterium]